LWTEAPQSSGSAAWALGELLMSIESRAPVGRSERGVTGNGKDRV
jgi:hypothetical protein